jgi:RecJ-like exonuclease
MAMCSKSWRGVGCVSEALPDRDVCAVHAKVPMYAPATGELSEINLDLDDPIVVKTCFNENADCPECDGSGDCHCHCGDQHDCPDCNGRGKVTGCRFCEKAMDSDATHADKRDHLEGCEARQTFITHVSFDTLDRDEKKLYDALMKDIGPVDASEGSETHA